MAVKMDWEWCSNCGNEVEIPVEKGVYNCPSCNVKIIPCNQCETFDCDICPLNSEIMKSLNKCTFCGNKSQAETKQVNGYTILKDCLYCENEILQNESEEN